MAPLPEGWREFKAPDGRPYYQRPDKSTTWERPAPSATTATPAAALKKTVASPAASRQVSIAKEKVESSGDEESDGEEDHAGGQEKFPSWTRSENLVPKLQEQVRRCYPPKRSPPARPSAHPPSTRLATDAWRVIGVARWTSMAMRSSARRSTGKRRRLILAISLDAPTMVTATIGVPLALSGMLIV